MIYTTITFDKDNVQPPVFVAGAFTDWTPQEMAFETVERNDTTKNVFTYKSEIKPGQHQYKFRLGPGDWWVIDESMPTVTDEIGNVNNVVTVEELEHSHEPPVETISKPAWVINTKGAYIMDDEREMKGNESNQAYPPPEEIVPNLFHLSHPDQPETTQSAHNPEQEKHVQFDEQTGEITAEVVPARKDSIPDFAPPPYSAGSEGPVSNAEEADEQVAPQAEEPPQEQEQPSQPAFKKTPSNTGSKQHSFVAQICTPRGLVTIAAMVAIPVAVSYYLRR